MKIGTSLGTVKIISTSNFSQKANYFWKVIAKSRKSGRKTVFYLQEGHWDEIDPGFICFGSRWKRKNDFQFYGTSVALAVDAIEANYGVDVIEWQRY